jgi:uncharacterized protein
LQNTNINAEKDTAVRNKLMLLEELQEFDLKMDGFQGEKQGLLDELAGLERRLMEAREELAAMNCEVETQSAEKQTLEENLATEQANIARSETNLKEIKTQKEYQAVSKEIATAKKLIGELEEQLLQKISEIEALRADLATREENLTALEQNVAGQRAEVQAKLDRLEASIAVDRTSREETAKGVPGSILKRYEKLREARRGVAVVEARDGSCLGCNMQIPPQLYNNLFRGEELITCPHCQRMLVLRQEPQA